MEGAFGIRLPTLQDLVIMHCSDCDLGGIQEKSHRFAENRRAIYAVLLFFGRFIPFDFHEYRRKFLCCVLR